VTDEHDPDPDLRDWLRARELPTSEVPIPVNPVAYAVAEREADRATHALRVAETAGVDLAPYRERVAAAQAALAGQPVRVLALRCLPVTEWEALVDAHPPTDEQRTLGWQWDVAGFRPALLAATVIVPDGTRGLTEVDWRQVADEGQLAVGELGMLFAAAIDLNSRAPSASVGKG